MNRAVKAVQALHHRTMAKHRRKTFTMDEHRGIRKKMASHFRSARSTPEGRAKLRAQVKSSV